MSDTRSKHPAQVAAEARATEEGLRERWEATQENLRERFDAPISTATRLTQRTLAWFPVRVWRHFLLHNGFLLAAGVSYQALFAFFAMIYVAFAITGLWLGGSPQAIDALIDIINSYIPGLISDSTGSGLFTTEQVTAIATSSAGVLVATGVIALGAVIWTAIGFVTYARRAVRDIFGIDPDRRSYFLLKTRDLLAAIIFGIALLLGSAATAVGTWALGLAFDLLGLGTAHRGLLAQRPLRIGHRVARALLGDARDAREVPDRHVAPVAADLARRHPRRRRRHGVADRCRLAPVVHAQQSAARDVRDLRRTAAVVPHHRRHHPGGLGLDRRRRRGPRRCRSSRRPRPSGSAKSTERSCSPPRCACGRRGTRARARRGIGSRGLTAPSPAPRRSSPRSRRRLPRAPTRSARSWTDARPVSASAARLAGVPRRVRIASVNVNGIRAATRKGMLEWLADADVDIMALQEVRATADELATALPGWEFVNDEALAKGRAGVAVASRTSSVDVRRVLDDEETLDSAGRWIEVDFDIDGERLTVVSAYVPTGEADTARQDAKWAFLDAMEKRMPRLAAESPLALVMGDLNVGHRELDIRNWKGNVKKAGFLPRERAYFDRFLGAAGEPVTGVDGSVGTGLGWVDVGRRAAARSTDRTRGGPTAARRSTTTPAGASTTTSRLRRSRSA